jgi:hypothetical protein
MDKYKLSSKYSRDKRVVKPLKVEGRVGREREAGTALGERFICRVQIPPFP